jgi:acyl-CoA dehydrogenase
MIRTTAVRDGEHYVINGRKRFISHAEGTDFLQVVAATDCSKGARGGLSMFLVDADTLGFQITRKTPTMMGDVTYELAFDDMRVPAENLVGGEGRRHAPRPGLDHRRADLSGLPRPRRRPACRRACRDLRAAARHLRRAAQRTAGDPIHDRGLLHGAPSREADQKTLARHESYITKIFCTELGFRAADRCMQIHAAWD